MLVHYGAPCTNRKSISQEYGQVKMGNASRSLFFKKNLRFLAGCWSGWLTASDCRTVGLCSLAQELVHRVPNESRDRRERLLGE